MMGDLLGSFLRQRVSKDKAHRKDLGDLWRLSTVLKTVHGNYPQPRKGVGVTYGIGADLLS